MEGPSLKFGRATARWLRWLWVVLAFFITIAFMSNLRSWSYYLTVQKDAEKEFFYLYFFFFFQPDCKAAGETRRFSAGRRGERLQDAPEAWPVHDDVLFGPFHATGEGSLTAGKRKWDQHVFMIEECSVHGYLWLDCRVVLRYLVDILITVAKTFAIQHTLLFCGIMISKMGLRFLDPCRQKSMAPSMTWRSKLSLWEFYQMVNSCKG